MGTKKRAICMADGGITKESPDEIMARMAAKYGLQSSGGQKGVPPAEQPTQQQPQQAAPRGIAAPPERGIINLLKNRQQQIDKAAGYANGGIVKGKGGPRSDDVPVKIRGEDYNLSATEVVLPSKTRQALGELLGAKPGDVEGANHLVEKFIQETNDGRPPVDVTEGKELANGGLLDGASMTYDDVTNRRPPAAASAQAPVSASSAPVAPERPTTTGVAPATPQDGFMRTHQPGDANSITYPPILSKESAAGLADGAKQAFSSTIGAIQKSGDAAQQAAAEGNYGGAVGHVIRGAVGGIAGFGDDVMRSAAKAIDPAANALKTLATGDSSPINRPAQPAAPVKSIADFAVTAGQQSPRPGSAAAALLNETDNFPQSKPGDPAAPQSVGQRPGRNENGVITAESAAAAMGNDMQRSGGITGSMDMKGVNDIMARENKARGEMIDLSIKANGGNGIGILPDYQPPQQGGMSIADLQGAMKSAGTRTERAAYGQALQTMLSGQNQTGLEQIRQQGIAAGHGVQMRGQDMAAMSDAARIAGNPVENELRKAQAGGIAAQTESYRLISDLQQKAAAGDQKAIAALRTINGKADDRFKTNVVGGGTNEIGQVQPQYLAVTGPDGQTRFVTPTGSQQPAKQGQAPASAIEYLKKNPGQAEAFKAKYGYLPEGF